MHDSNRKMNCSHCPAIRIPEFLLTEVFVCLLFVVAEIGPVTITTDPKKFQTELKELYVQVTRDVLACDTVLQFSLTISYEHTIHVFKEKTHSDA